MPKTSIDDQLKVSRSEGIALLRWTFTVVGAVMSALLIAASQAGDNLSFYLMTITFFKLSLMIFLVLLGMVFAMFVGAFTGYSDRESRDRWVRFKRVKSRFGKQVAFWERIRREWGRLWLWLSFTSAILVGVILPLGTLHFGSNSLKADMEMSRELQLLQISAFKSELMSGCEQEENSSC